MGLEVRRIRAHEGPQLRPLRLHALADAPTAFGSTLAREEAFPESVWHERAARGASGGDGVTFIAEHDGQWVGLATGLVEDPEDAKGSGPVLVGMFVDRGKRRCGVGVALVEAVASWARERGAARLALWVTSSNEPAIALYRRCGFRPTGDTKPLAHTPTLTELRMVRVLQ
ncbi:MAG TPA: GNAT family N-acetyltransferase [Verrucomicrobiae bacterium]|jgi:GNAT superfamily N-acetyltransferase|nr:GNAT family N-acetyltransferase [Methylomirabilota bacterium]HWN93047.1 GNAT family N-acetyltransferase [Verrucomicrobiae bacterium]